MAPLVVYWSGVEWYVFVPNTRVGYFFAGGTSAEQLANARAFAQSLADGDTDIYEFLDLKGAEPATVERQLFLDTDCLVYGDQIRVLAEAGDFLMSVIDDVGEFLLLIF